MWKYELQDEILPQTDCKVFFSQTEEETAYSLRRIMQLNSPEWLSIVVGVLCSMAAGVCQPAFTLILTEYIRVSQHLIPRYIIQLKNSV